MPDHFTRLRDSSKRLPAYAWPGGYPIIYIMSDGEVLCPDCANGENGAEPTADPEDHSDWRLDGHAIHWEGDPEFCCHCGAEIESAYGSVED